MAAQPLAAGDQMTGAGPLVSGFGQPCSSRVAAAPDDLRVTRTDTQSVADLGVGLVEGLGQVGRAGSPSPGETAMSTVTQSGSKPGRRAVPRRRLRRRRPRPSRRRPRTKRQRAERPGRTCRAPGPLLIVTLLPARDLSTRSSRRDRVVRFPRAVRRRRPAGAQPVASAPSAAPRTWPSSSGRRRRRRPRPRSACGRRLDRGRPSVRSSRLRARLLGRPRPRWCRRRRGGAGPGAGRAGVFDRRHRSVGMAAPSGASQDGKRVVVLQVRAGVVGAAPVVADDGREAPAARRRTAAASAWLGFRRPRPPGRRGRPRAARRCRRRSAR